MDKKIIARVLLQMLPQIDGYCETLARKNYRNAIKSQLSEYWDAERIMERIIDKTFRAQQLQSLKKKIEKQLLTAPEKTQTVIQLFFLKDQKIAKIAEKLNVTERTIFREINKSVDWFSNQLDWVGMTPVRFQELLSQNPLVRENLDSYLRTLSSLPKPCIA